MAIRSVSKLRRTESLGAASMATLKSESDTTDEDCTIEGVNNLSELDYKVIEIFSRHFGSSGLTKIIGVPGLWAAVPKK